MPKKQTPYGVIDVDANGNAVDTPATRAALAASKADNPQAGVGGAQMPTTEEAVTAGQQAGTTDYNPGYTPDYKALIEGDPIWQQEQAQLAAQGIQSAAERKAGTDRALINFGEVPDLNSSINGLGLDPNSPMFRMLFGDVDQMTRQSADDMTHAGLSTTAKLGVAHNTSMDSLLAALAARGSIRSGATGVGTGLEGQRYSGAQFDARSNLLDYLTGLQSAYTQSENARQGQRVQGLTDATGRQIAEHPTSAPSGTAPTGTSLQPPPVAPSGDPTPSVVPTYGAPQSSGFGGSNGPYVSGYPAPPKAPKAPSAQSIASRLNWQR